MTTTTRGEIVEVEGGHIIRSTGRKDRHSKVCTAKGPRDRRVRLSAHTAIQFYDVQDRLGFDRPSKAVDWLINKAKSAIDDLAKLPPWDPSTQNQHMNEENQNENDDAVGFHRVTAPDESGGGGVLDQLDTGSGFLDADIDDPMKSFFPMAATAATETEASSSGVQFQNYLPDFLSQKQDLRLSLQSFQDPILLQQAQTQTNHLHHHHHHHHHQNKQFFSANTPLWFDGENSNPEEHNRLHRTITSNNSSAAGTNHRGIATPATSAGGVGGGGFIFNSPSPMSTLSGQSQLFSQRGPLQSSNTPSIRAWIDPSSIPDHHHQHYLPPALFHHQPPVSGGTGFTSGGFSGFRIPARIQGEDEEDDGVSEKPSSASSDSRH